jgi:16S rRNA U516 pseudouridylate synthase RsuA-like enzyme
MCGQAGLPVQRLARVQEGGLKLGDLPAGKWRYLTEAEVDMLKGEKSDG